MAALRLAMPPRHLPMAPGREQFMGMAGDLGLGEPAANSADGSPGMVDAHDRPGILGGGSARGDDDAQRHRSTGVELLNHFVKYFC